MNRRTLIQSLIAGLATGTISQRTLASGSIAETKGTGMLIVTFEVEFADDQIHGKLDAIRAMDAATLNEDGCLAYKTSFDATNPNIMRIYEMWESMDALIPHFQKPHMAVFQGELAGLQPKSMDAKVYEISNELPFPNQS